MPIRTKINVIKYKNTMITKVDLNHFFLNGSELFGINPPNNPRIKLIAGIAKYKNTKVL